jgi:hypothetical protein
MSEPYFSGWHRKKIFLAAFALLVSTASFLAWQHYFPVTAGAGWTWKIYLDDVELVSALARDEQGILYLTQEFNKQRGKLLKQLPNGALQEVMAGLDKPDGLATFRGGMLISQESAESPVLWLHQGQKTELFRGRHIEGIASDEKLIYAIEDVSAVGRLLRYDPATRQVDVLRDDLNVGEGLAICPDGRIFYSEKKSGWIKLYRPALAVDPVAHGGLNQPGFLLCNEEGLWIAEDATHGARLLQADASGTLSIVLDHLRSGQTILPIAPGRLLVAEQGRKRILEISRIPSGKP